MGARARCSGIPVLCAVMFGAAHLGLAYPSDTVNWVHGIVPTVYRRKSAMGKTCNEIKDKDVRAILRDLKSGYGVDDIAARGTASKDQARAVINFMRKHGLTERFYGKEQKDVDDNGSGDSGSR